MELEVNKMNCIFM